MQPESRRPYDATRRRASAEQRRQEVLETARGLFANYGYGATTIEQIAHEAGVAVPTVYAMFHTKRALLFALLDFADSHADVAGLKRELRAASGEPRTQLRRVVAFTCRFYAQTADIIEIARGAGTTNDDLVALWREGEERRLNAQRPLTTAWRRAGALRKGISAAEALDTLWAMTGADCYRLFVVEREWSADRFEAWLGDSLERLLFDEGRRRSGDRA